MNLTNKIQSTLGKNYVGFDVNEWGSCQYSSALNIFNALIKLNTPDTNPLEELGIQISYIDILSIPDSLTILGKILSEKINDRLSQYEEDYVRWSNYLYHNIWPFDENDNLDVASDEDFDFPENTDEFTFIREPSTSHWFDEMDEYEQRDYAKDQINRYFAAIGKIHHFKTKGVSCIEEAFITMKHMSSDLWSAAPIIAEIIFKNLDIQVESSPGYGPPGNVCVQSDNYTVGTCCWLLVNHGFVKNSTSAFGGFDT